MVNGTVTRKMAGTDNSQIFMVKRHVKIFSITNNQRGKRRRGVGQIKSLQISKMTHYRQLVKSRYNGIS